METWYRVAALCRSVEFSVLMPDSGWALQSAVTQAPSSPGQPSRSMSLARSQSVSAQRSWRAGFPIRTPGCLSSSGSSAVTARRSRPIPWNHWHSGKRRRQLSLCLAYVSGSVVAGLVAVVLGTALGRGLGQPDATRRSSDSRATIPSSQLLPSGPRDQQDSSDLVDVPHPGPPPKRKIE